MWGGVAGQGGVCGETRMWQELGCLRPCRGQPPGHGWAQGLQALWRVWLVFGTAGAGVAVGQGQRSLADVCVGRGAVYWGGSGLDQWDGGKLADPRDILKIKYPGLGDRSGAEGQGERRVRSRWVGGRPLLRLVGEEGLDHTQDMPRLSC